MGIPGDLGMIEDVPQEWRELMDLLMAISLCKENNK